MDAFIGSWKLIREKNEGLTKEYAKALGVSADNFAQFEKMAFTIVIARAEGDKYTYSYCMDGVPEPFVQGPFTMGHKFEFYDSWEKRTEENVFSLDGDKMKEVSVIKENPSCSWTVSRFIQDGTMVAATTVGEHKSKQFFTKV